MIKCYICNLSFAAALHFRNHFKTHELLGDIILPLKCLNCPGVGTYSKTSSFMRHMETYHISTKSTYSKDTDGFTNLASDGASNFIQFDTCAVANEATNVSLASNEYDNNVENVSWKDAMRNEAASLVASLRSNSCIPHSLVPNIMQSCNAIVNYP